MVESITIEDLYFEIKALRKEIKELKKEDLTNFVGSLKEHNLLANKEEAEKVGLKL